MSGLGKFAQSSARALRSDTSVPRSNRKSSAFDQYSTHLQLILLQDNFYNYCLSESARRDRARDVDRVCCSHCSATGSNDSCRVCTLVQKKRTSSNCETRYHAFVAESKSTAPRSPNAHKPLCTAYKATRISTADSWASDYLSQIITRRRRNNIRDLDTVCLFGMLHLVLITCAGQCVVML